MRNTYYVTISTPRGSMSVTFWDSVHNTQVSQMTIKELAVMRGFDTNKAIPYEELSKLQADLRAMKAKATPTPYDVLACLTKDSAETFDDFCAEYGYNNDSIKALKTYIACNEEYSDIKRIFTAEQIKALREIC